MVAEFVTFDVRDRIATIRIGRPPVNALSLQVLRELAAAADVVSQDSGVDAVVVYGGEKVFAAGDDLGELLGLDAVQARAMTVDRHVALGVLDTIRQPTVAAISNYALGGGLELALGADRRIVGDNVKLGLQQVLAGEAPSTAGMVRLAALVGPSKAKDLVFTGRFVGADEAVAMGLVDEVVAPDDVYDAAHRWAGQFVGAQGSALAAAKAAINAAISGGISSPS